MSEKIKAVKLKKISAKTHFFSPGGGDIWTQIIPHGRALDQLTCPRGREGWPRAILNCVQMPESFPGGDVEVSNWSIHYTANMQHSRQEYVGKYYNPSMALSSVQNKLNSIAKFNVSRSKVLFYEYLALKKMF